MSVISIIAPVWAGSEHVPDGNESEGATGVHLDGNESLEFPELGLRQDRAEGNLCTAPTGTAPAPPQLLALVP